MIMKKVAIILTSVMLVAASAFAQDETFFPHWNLQLKGGAGHTVGETEFVNLISPAAGLAVGYQFTPVVGLRADFSGWQAKGILSPYVVDQNMFKYNYGQGALDVTFDLCNLFGGFKTRVVNPYVFAGLGANYRFNNDEAVAMKADFPVKNYLWEDPTISMLGRVGVGADIRLCDAVSLSLEIADNILSDHFNNKVGDVFDYQVNAMAGLKFNFGIGKKKAAAAAAAAAAAEEAARLAAEKAAAEKAAADAAAAKAKAEAEEAARLAAEKAAQERANARKANENVLFLLDRSDIRDNQTPKIDNIVKIMNEYPEAKIVLTGNADKWTGYPAYNLKLSKKRADIVTEALVKAGIDPSRIETKWVGDTQNEFPTPEENRVTVCVVK